MLNRHQVLQVFLWIVFIIQVPFLHAQDRISAELLSSDETGVTIRISVSGYTMRKVLQDGISYTQFDFGHDAAVTGETGMPQLTEKTFMFIAPAGASVSRQITALEYEDLQDVRLLPNPLYSYDESEMPVSVTFPEGDQYKEDRFLPDQNVKTAVSVFRDWNTVNVSVSPVSFNPVQNRVRIWKRATLRIGFINGKYDDIYARTTASDQSLYEGMFMNYEYGKRWKISAQSPKKQQKSANTLATGAWYKIKISEDGFYKLDKSFFSDIGVKISSINPKTIKIYNNGGNNLPLLPDSLSFADPNNIRGVRGLTLTENAIRVIGEADNKFDNQDYVLFYARGTKNWHFDSTANKYIYRTNYYSEDNIYWLTFNDGIEGKRILIKPSSSGEAAVQNNFLHRYHYEKDEENVYQSGLVWVHKPLSNGQSAVYPETGLIPSGGLLNNIDPAFPVKYTIKVKGSSLDGRHRFTASIDGQHSTTGNEFYNLRSQLITINALPASISSGKVTLSYGSTQSGSLGSLDWFEMEYYRKLKMYQNELQIFSPVTAGNYLYAVSLQGTSPSSVTVFDITDFSAITEIQPSETGGDTLRFRDDVTSKRPKKYSVISVGAYKKVSKSSVSLDQNSDLQNTMNSADYIIISHKNFVSESQRLAQHRQQLNGFKTMVIDVQDVFDEFGCGLPDPVAIRDFLRYAYYRWQSPLKHDKLMYVVLMGDGDYDYRNVAVKSDHNWIPTIQIQSDYTNGDYPINTRQVDDAFCYLNDLSLINDNTDVNFIYPYISAFFPDLAIGRIPCNNTEQARAAVDKTIFFENSDPLEAWKQSFTFVSDDEVAAGDCDGLGMHTRPADILMNDTSAVPGYFRKEKIYLIDFPHEMIGSVRFKRAARDRFIEIINQGSAVINYVGHGNPKQLAHERVYMDETDFPMIQNKDKYFYFTNFSCSFAKFDAIDRQGGGEKLVVTPNKGAFALFAATRVVYSGHHTRLMSKVFKWQKQTGKIGLAIMRAKLNEADQLNNEKYNLLGDPAVSIKYADRKINFTMIDPPTVKALTKTTVSGFVDNGFGQPDIAFNGDVLISLADRSLSKRYRSTCLNDTSWIDFALDGQPLYIGKVKAANGIFSTQFIVPKDISYSNEKGKLTAIASGGQILAATANSNIVIDTATQFISDSVGPVMNLQFEGQQFANGDAVRENPVLVVYLSDSSGINITGSTGHQIQLDVDNRMIYNLTPHFISERDSFTHGTARLTLYNLNLGKHTATLSAFDNANNVTKQSFSFTVVKTGTDLNSLDKISLKDVMNFPNPFSKETHFTFTSNHPSGDVEIKIFTVAGRLIRKMEGTAVFGYNSIRWDGRDDDGNRLANGIYLYKIDLKSQVNQSRSHFIGKIMIAK